MFTCNFYVRKLASIWVSIPRTPCIYMYVYNYYNYNLLILPIIADVEKGLVLCQKEPKYLQNSSLLQLKKML